jgi:outer membrane protein assembly factor BamB
VSKSTKPLPAAFSPAKNVRWSKTLGDGIGSPVVAAGRVFSNAVVGDRSALKLVVHAFDAETGDQLWERDFAAGKKLAPVTEPNDYASATPAADAERVYVYFAPLGLIALDTKTGMEIWRYPVPEPFFIFDWGPGMSPVLYKDKLFFCQDDDVSPALYCIDKKSGKLLWKDDRSDMAVSYSHPVVLETAKGPELVVAGTGKVLGYNIDTGKRVWAAELFCRNIKTTPVALGDTVYVSVESIGISYQWRATADLNKDGKITREEIINSRKDKTVPIPEAFWKKFERGDVNKDGVLEGDEIDKAFLDPSNQGGLLDREVQARAKGEKDWEKWNADLQAEASIQAIRGGGKGDVTKTHVLWKHKSKGVDHIVSPLVLDGRMWLIKSDGFCSAYETTKGEQLWLRERLSPGSNYLASPVAGDGKIYMAGRTGKLLVLESGPKLKILAVNDFGKDEPLVATPALADGRIYVRSRTRLFCFAETGK